MTPSRSAFAKRNFSLAWPLALNALLMQSMLLVDTLLVAPLGVRPLASMGIATTIIALVLGLQFALASGTQLIVGRAKGSQDRAALTKAFKSGLLINLTTALFLWLCILFVGPSLIAILIDDPALIELTSAYLSIAQYLILITAFTQLCTSFFNGCGETKVPLKGYLIELPFNIVVSFVLIHGIGDYTGLGATGAAWGSLTAVGLRMIYLFYCLKKSSHLESNLRPSNNLLTDCRTHFKEILPIAANFMVLSLGMSVYQLLFAKLDLYSYAAITLVYPWIRMGSLIITGWAHASAINISQIIGQKQSDEIPLFVNVSIRLAMLIACFLSLLFFALSQSMTLIYPNIAPESHLALAAIAPIYILLPLVRTYNTVAGHSLRSLGQSLKVLRIHFINQWLISLPICALMVLVFKLSVFWVFAMIAIEEVLKAIPFSRLMKSTLIKLEN